MGLNLQIGVRSAHFWVHLKVLSTSKGRYFGELLLGFKYFEWYSMIMTAIHDHHLPLAGYTIQLFGSYHFKSSPEKDSKKTMVIVTVAPICKIRLLYGYCMNKFLIFEVLITTL